MEVYKKRPKHIMEHMDILVEKLKEAVAEGTEDVVQEEIEKEIKKSAGNIVEFTVEESFSRMSSVDSYHGVQRQKEKLKEEMRRHFTRILEKLLEDIPKIIAVYKPVLRNRDICSLALPDYQVETVEGHVLIEVKNMWDLKQALKEGKLNLFFYNFLLSDLELGDSTWELEKLPTPVSSFLVVPRHGVVREIKSIMPNFREIAVEIWKIKRAALVERVLPDTWPVASVCKKCQYRLFCKKEKTEQLEDTKPIPLIYTLAKHEAEKEEQQLSCPKNSLKRTFSLKEKPWKATKKPRSS
ncbi:MAG: hypothetical protein QXW47_09990 [Candidatus Jordarchaeales archaeon]